MLVGITAIAVIITAIGYTRLALTTGPADSGYEAPSQPLLTAEGSQIFVGDPAEDRRAPTPDRVAILTFDDGPDPRWTPGVLSILEKYGAPATFFVTGSQALRNRDLAREIVARGHEVGAHSFSHPRVGSLPGWKQGAEIAYARRAIVSATGRRPVTYRPPYSSRDVYLPEPELTAARRAAEDGMALVLTSHPTQDTDPGATAASITRAALRGPDDGARIILMHDSGSDRQASLDALGRIIPILTSRGYEFRTAGDIAGFGADPMAYPGWRERQAAHISSWIEGVSRLDIAYRGHISVFLIIVAIMFFGRSLALLVLAVLHRYRNEWNEDYVVPVTVVVPAYNEEMGIEAAVRSLAASDHPDVEIIVVDDGSTDRTAEIVNGLDIPGVRLIRQTNAGKAAALNRGVAAASHDHVVLVDGDSVLAKDALRLILRPFRDPHVGAVAGNVRVANPRGLIGKLQSLEYALGCDIERRMLDVIGAIGVIPGAAGAFRVDALRNAGGMPRDTITEDADVTMAIGQQGWRIVTIPEAVAFTEAPETWPALWKQRYRWTYGMLQTVWKHRHSPLSSRHHRQSGRLTVPYLVMFGPLGFLIAPLVDFYLIVALFFGGSVTVIVLLAAFSLAMILHAMAVRWQREPLWYIALVPVQQILLRAFAFGVYYVSLRDVIFGRRPGWKKLERRGIDLAVTEKRSSA